MPHTPSLSDTFRINMQLGFGPLQPATPVPISPAVDWWDVSNWQTFLLTHAFPATNPPNDLFSQMDTQGTKQFQMAKSLTPNGVVNLATYNAAVAAGMLAFPTVTV